MVTNDLLNTTLADLKGPIEHTFAQKALLHKALVERGRVSSDRGTLIERTIMGGSPAQATGIFGGGETLNLTRTEQTHKIQLQMHRLVVPISIPKLDMLQNDGKLGVIKLVETYVASVQNLLPADFDRFLFSGVSHGNVASTAQMTGWNTLNGQKTFASGKVGVTNGLIDFAATTSQTDTVQNLAKSSSYNYVNQFREITSYADNGDRTYRGAIRDIAKWNHSGDGDPDIAYLDYDSFALFEEDHRAHVRIVNVQADMDSKSVGDSSLTLGGTKIQGTGNIILTDFTGSAAEGLGYFLTMSGLEWIWFQKPTLSSFEDRIANQDAVVAKLEMMGGLVCTNMRLQGAVVGGTRA